MLKYRNVTKDSGFGHGISAGLNGPAQCGSDSDFVHRRLARTGIVPTIVRQQKIPKVLDLHARQSLIHIPGLFDYRPGCKRRYRQLSYHHK